MRRAMSDEKLRQLEERVQQLADTFESLLHPRLLPPPPPNLWQELTDCIREVQAVAGSVRIALDILALAQAKLVDLHAIAEARELPIATAAEPPTPTPETEPAA
jgi:hypothetical protein